MVHNEKNKHQNRFESEALWLAFVLSSNSLSAHQHSLHPTLHHKSSLAGSDQGGSASGQHSHSPLVNPNNPLVVLWDVLFLCTERGSIPSTAGL